MSYRLLPTISLLILTLPVATQSGNMQEDKSPHGSGFATVNGIKLHYLDWGGKGEALLFITGRGDNAHVFDEMAPKFTDRFHVLALTRRGFGESDKPETGYDVATRAEDVRHFLDIIKIKRVNLVGHSSGGDELTQFASVYPRRTLKLVYLDAAYDRSDIAAIEAKDPLSMPNEPPKSKVQMAYSEGVANFHPDYRMVKAPALSYYALIEAHWALTPDNHEPTRKKAEEYIETEVKPFQLKYIERFRKEVVNGQVVVMRGAHHYFFRDPDPKRRDEVVREIRAFLSSK